MTCGERFIRCLLGEQIDRVPFGVGVGWMPWGETVSRWQKESGNEDLDVVAHFGFDRSVAIPTLHSGIHPGFDPIIIEESDEFVISRNSCGITMRNLRSYSSMPEFLDYPIKTPEDWEKLKDERLRIDDPSRIVQDWDEYRTTIRETGEAVQVGVFPYGVFGAVRDLMGVEEMLVAFHTEPEMIRDMMEHLTSLWISLWERVAHEVRIDHIHIWEDMSGRQGSLISPKMVENFMMPCYDRITDFARANSVRIISVDTDGDCRELVPIFMKHGINMMFPFEVQAGNDVLRYRREYPELGIIGGLDKRALAAGKTEIDVEVRKAAEMVTLGRYIPGFDHLIAPDATWSNFCYAVDRIREVCFGKLSF